MTHSRAQDEQQLKMLDLRDAEHLTCKEIGLRFGKSKGSVLGMLYRIDKAELPCLCQKPENQDGGMPRGWWR